MFTNISTADKIETIVDCYLKDHTCMLGFFGRVAAIDADGSVLVETDGRSFHVWQDASDLWNVSEGDAVGVDARLVYAASNLIGADLVRKRGRI